MRFARFTGNPAREELKEMYVALETVPASVA
jgi:hypothetical protein